MYEAETKDESPEAILAGLKNPPEEYATELFVGTGRRAGEIDAVIAAHARAWALDRMPAVDRQLLRIATYELAFGGSVPVAVAIDEAVALAQEFSTEQSGRYVNGVLAGIAADLAATGSS